MDAEPGFSKGPCAPSVASDSPSQSVAKGFGEVRAEGPIALGIEEELKGDGGVGVFVLALRFKRLSNHVRKRMITVAGNKMLPVIARTSRVNDPGDEDDDD